MGKPFSALTNSERITIDDLIAGRNQQGGLLYGKPKRTVSGGLWQ
jgi:hypothetical protein